MSAINIFDGSKNRYNDVLLFVVLIPLINALNYYLTYSTISFSAFTLITFLIDTFTGYISWLMVKMVILLLDRKLPYGARPLRRILVQLAATTVTGLLTIILITEGVNGLFADHPVPRSFYTFDIFIFIIWIFVINGIYIGLHYYTEWSTSESERRNEKLVRKTGFLVSQGKQQLFVQFEEIACLYIEGEYVILLSSASKKYFLSQSLDTCETSLPEEWFFRLNRQILVHRAFITGFNRVENGKLEVFLKPMTGEMSPVLVSRTKAAAFKKWFQPEPTSLQG